MNAIQQGAPDKTLQQLDDAKPTLPIKGKDGRLRAKRQDANGNERIRIDPADKLRIIGISIC